MLINSVYKKLIKKEVHYCTYILLLIVINPANYLILFNPMAI